MSDLPSPREPGDSGSSGLDGADESVRSMTDAGLVIAMTTAAVDALAEAYDRHGRFVYGLALRLCGEQQSEAMTREVFLALWRSPADFANPATSLRATLIADMHRRVTTWLRSEHSRRRGETPVAGGAELQRMAQEEPADHDQERRSPKLPNERSALHLAYFRGYTYTQIAAVVGRPEAAVAADLHTQRRRLSTQID